MSRTVTVCHGLSPILCGRFGPVSFLRGPVARLDEHLEVRRLERAWQTIGELGAVKALRGTVR